MNAHTLILALSLVVAPVAAQTAPPAAERVSPHPAPAAPAPQATDDRPSSHDPRVCLEFPTREQVIACAERFRSKRTTGKSQQ